MSKLLMKSLKADLPALAELIRSQGRGKDTVLAHITPKEAALLKRRGGSGTINPDTGLPEFEDYGGDYVSGYDIDYGAPVPAPQAEIPYTEPVAGGYSGKTFFPDMATTQTANVPFDEPVSRAQAQQAAAQFPELYPGGKLPAPGEVTAFKPDQYGEATAQYQQPQPQKAWYEKLGLSPKDLTRLGLGAALTGGLAATNVARTRQAAQQSQAARGEMAAIGKPYQEAGAQLSGAAQRGELTPASQQALQAAQAQIAQGVATRGGVGATQAQTQIAALRNLMLENQYNFGLKVSQIGDSYALGAIKTGMEADRYLNQANQQFYGTLAQMLAPFITGAPSVTPTRTA
jgi:hypothetical protein